MRRLFARGIFLVCIVSSLFVLGSLAPVYGQSQYPNAVKIVAPDGVSARILMEPRVGAEVLDTALNGVIMEAVGPRDGFIEVKVPGRAVSGYVLKEHTKPWEAPPIAGTSPILIAALILAAAALLGAGLFWLIRAKRTKEVAVHAASIPAAIKRGEEHFRAGDYDSAITEFNNYLHLQGGEMRNPDVYRRLAVCYQQTSETREAIKCWEKMRSLGGLRTTGDYALGVELMSAQGREAEAADIYEQLLANETDDSKRYEIHMKLFETYRRLKEPEKLVNHARKLLPMGGDATQIISDTVNFLVTEGQTDLAIESNNKDLVKAICQEFVEDKAKTPEAGRIYLKCLEYDRTDQRLHKLLAEIYSDGGDYRRAVSELTILHQLDKEQSEVYMEQAARIYVENSRVQEAIAEGNPLIIKKIAQIFLARSEVHPDAVAVYEKVLEFQPKAVGVNKMLSTVYLTRGDLQKYMGKLRLLHEIDGANHDYLTDLAQCIIDNDLIEQTIREGNRDLNAKVLKRLIKQGASTDAAVYLFERLIKHERENAPIRGALAKAYEQRGEYAKSLEHMLHIITLRPDDEEVIEQAAKIAVERNVLGPVLQHGTGRLVILTAEKLVRAKADGEACRRLLQKAQKESPRNPVIDSYMESLKHVPVPARKASSVTEIPRPKVDDVPAAPPAPSSTAHLQKTESPKPPPAQKSVTASHHEEQPPPRTLSAGGTSKAPATTTRGPSKPVKSEKGASAAPGEAKGPGPEAPPQSIAVTDQAVPMSEKAITTFVTAHAQGSGSRLRYTREELFLPATGGLAYKDIEHIATDGWGDLRTAAEVNTDRLVLIRIFKKDLLEPTAMKEFVQQVSDLSFNMVHESILPLEEAVTGPESETGLVHPYLPRTLEQVVKADKTPDLNVRIGLVAKIVDGLAHAHSYKGLDGRLRRTFHLHLQPSMIFVSEDLSLCQISGLGYAQLYRNLTRGRRPWWEEPGMNPATMPPEFFRTKPAAVPERASEVYSLGALIYFATTGEFPFEGPTFDDYKFQHTRVFAAPPRLINSAVPDWLEPVILGCLEKEPEKRWGSIAEIQQAFKRGMTSG